MHDWLPFVIDLEASGFGRGSYPIEVGTVLGDGTLRCFLIRPEPEWTHWDVHAEAVHGIPRRILEQRGVPVAEVATRLNQLLGGQTVYTDGWGFDLTWLAKLLEFAGASQHFQLGSVRCLLEESQVGHWHVTYTRVMTELAARRRRASSDALVVQKTLQQIRTLV